MTLEAFIEAREEEGYTILSRTPDVEHVTLWKAHTDEYGRHGALVYEAYQLEDRVEYQQLFHWVTEDIEWGYPCKYLEGNLCEWVLLSDSLVDK